MKNLEEKVWPEKKSPQKQHGQLGELRKLVKLFERNIKRGFSEDNYRQTAGIYRQISFFVDQPTYQHLGAIWRNSYTRPANPKELKEEMQLIFSSIIDARSRYFRAS